MATAAQIAANQRNAQHSTGPRTAEGKARTSLNSTRFGVYARHDYSHPKYMQQDADFGQDLLARLAPTGALEEALAAEILRAFRRLDACAIADKKISTDPEAGGLVDVRMPAIDRARVCAERTRDRALTELRRLQTERVWRKEFLSDNFNLSADGIGEHRDVFRSFPAERRFQLLIANLPAVPAPAVRDDLTALERQSDELLAQAKIAEQTQFPAAVSSL